MEEVEGGRWDCIAVIRRPGGGYFGYWTATPQPSAALCGNTTSCGAGFGESDDGLHWRALPTPGPPVTSGSRELGGVAQLGGRVFMVFNGGQLFEAPSAAGPFVASASNHDFLGQQGNVWFARLWGVCVVVPVCADRSSLSSLSLSLSLVHEEEEGGGRMDQQEGESLEKTRREILKVWVKN